MENIMKLPYGLQEEIINFLKSVPNIDRNATKQALISSASLDANLQSQIYFEESSSGFFQLLLPTLVNYGKLEDGRSALEAVLEAAKNFIGSDRQLVCDELLQKLSTLRQEPKQAPITVSVQAGITPSFVKKVLILASNPTNTERLRLNREVQEITEGLRRSKQGEQFCIEEALAMNLSDVRRALLDHDPQIVQFSGHGYDKYGEEAGLIFEDEQGNSSIVSPKALAGLFGLFSRSIECVLLKACYSELHMQVINQHIPYVIGIKTDIGHKAVLEFLVGFYDALGAGKSIGQAFEFGTNAIQPYRLPEHLIPVLVGTL